MDQTTKVVVFGGGSWATALVKMLCENLSQVGWYMRNEEAISYIKENNHNPNYLPSATFDVNQLYLSNDLNEMVAYADLMILAIPSAFVDKTLSQISVPFNDKIIFSAIKGVVPESEKIVGLHLKDVYNIPIENIGVITGPCHAEEVAMERLSYLTIACQFKQHAELMVSLLKGHYIKCKISDDIIGTEYAAMLKNIFAIASGIAHGMGYGDNFQAVLMSNAIREMKKCIAKVHKMKRNINNSAYLGDLLVTGYSTFSRNRMFGNMIGKGYTVKSAMMEMNMVAEGFYALKPTYELVSSFGIKAPIIRAVHDIIIQKKDRRKVMGKLTEKLN